MKFSMGNEKVCKVFWVMSWHDYLWNKTPWQGKQFFAVHTHKQIKLAPLYGTFSESCVPL
jgi:hypothetical protein